MPCAAGSYAWAVTAKDFGPLSGSLTTTVEGSCALRFVAQPASAERDTQIRAEEFRPDSAQLVSVEAVDGSPAPQRLTWFTGTIDLRLVQDGPGVLTPSPASSAAVAGLASFSDLVDRRVGQLQPRSDDGSGRLHAGRVRGLPGHRRGRALRRDELHR